MIPPPVMGAAARETGHPSAKRPDPLDLAVATLAAITVLCVNFSTRQRKIVTPSFIRHAEIGACLLPFRSMRGDAATPGAILSKQVCQFMTQRFIDLPDAELYELRIQSHKRKTVVGKSRRRAHPGVPANTHFRGKLVATEWAQKLSGHFCQRGIIICRRSRRLRDRSRRFRSYPRCEFG